MELTEPINPIKSEKQFAGVKTNLVMPSKNQIPSISALKVILPRKSNKKILFVILCLVFVGLVIAGSLLVRSSLLKKTVSTQPTISKTQEIQNTYDKGSTLYDQAFVGKKDGATLNQNDKKAVYSQAIQALDSVLKEQPTNTDALTKIVSAFYKIGDYASAEKYLLQYIPNDPNNTYLVNLLAYTYRQEKNFSKAEEYYQKSLSIDPMSVNTYLDFCALYLVENKKSDAINLLNAGLEKLPGNVGLTEKLANINK